MDGSSGSNTSEEWARALLAGFRFRPPEDEMVNLLKMKLEDKDSPSNHKPWGGGNNHKVVSLFLSFLKEMMQGKACHVIPEIDVCKFDAWDLPGLMFPDSPYQAREWFSFSRPDYKYTHGSICNRTTKHGFWKRTGKPRRINSGSVPCFKRTMTFHEGRVSKSNKTSWVMQEYYFPEAEAGCCTNQQNRALVLCRLKNKPITLKSDSKKLKDTSMFDELSDPGTGGYITSNSEGDRATADAAVLNYITDQQQHVLDAEAVDDMIQELWKSPRSEPPQLGNGPDVYNDDDSYPANNNNNYGYEPARHIAYNYRDQPTYEMSSEVYSQLEEQESLYHSYQPQNYTSQSPNSELGDFQHANNSIGCDGSQSQYPEIASLFLYSS